MSKFLTLGLLFFNGLLAQAASSHSLLYQARILTPSGSPLETTSTFQFTIKSPNGCVLWSETQTIAMTDSKGVISVEIGGGSNQASGSHVFSDIFTNGTTITGLTGCAGNQYQAGMSDDRTLYVSFNDGSGVHTLPSMPVRSVPFAHFANVAKSTMQLQGVDISPTAPTAGQVLQFNSVSGKWEATTPSTGGSVTSVGLGGSSIFNITGGPITTSGTINLALSSQNQNLIMASPDGSAGVPSFRALLASDIPMLDASKVGTGTFATARIPSLDAAKIVSGTLSAAVGGTGLVPGGAGDANKVYALNAAGTGTEYKSIVQGSGISVDTSVAGQITIAATNSGSVTNVGLTMPSIFSVANSPVTGAGTMNVSLANAGQNALFAGPASGGAGTPSFRTLAASDIPNMDAAKITSGTFNTAQIGALDASIVTTGTFATARLGQIPASIVSGTFLAASGTVGTPGISFSADPDTGLWNPGANTIAISVGGTEALRIDSGRKTIFQGDVSTEAGNLYTGNLISTSGRLMQQVPQALNYIAGSLAVGTNANPTAVLDVAGTTRTQSVALVGAGTVTVSPAASGNYSMTLPSSIGSPGQVLRTDGTGALSWTTLSAGGVTNVGLSGHSMFSITGSPVTGTGTMNIDLASQGANLILASPDGGAGTPSFRALAASDIPSLAASKITSGTLSTAQIGVLDASIVTTGTFATARLGQIPASIVAGTLSTAQIGLIPAANGGTGLNGGSAANGTLLIGNGSGYTLATLNISNGLSQTVGAGSISLTTNATNNNTASAIVARDPSGNFSAGAIDVASTGIRGSTAGTATINAPASFTNYTMTLPSSMGSAGQVLQTNGTSATTWVSAPVQGGTILAASGSAGTPGIAFNSDSDTGLWNPGANTLAISTGGSEAMRIDANGNVGIGTNSPQQRLDVRDNGNGMLEVNIQNEQSNTAAAAQTSICNSSGNCLKTTTYSAGFTTSGLDVANYGSLLASSGLSGMVVGTRGNAPLLFATNNTEHMRINSTGSVGIGTGSPNALLDVSGSARAQSMAIAGAGTVTLNAPSSGSYSLSFPTSVGSPGQVLITDGTSALSWSTVAPGGVTNVGLSGNSMFSITGSPVTGAGTMNIDWASQNQNLVLASPNGSVGTPSFRALTAADITTGTFALARLGQIPASLIDGTLGASAIGMVPAANGGTGLNGGSAANGTLLIGNGSGYTLATMNISNGLSQTLGAGSISLTTNATNNNTASTIVARDPSGNFSAGAIDVTSTGIRGGTAGTATINAPASFTNYTMTLPSSMGSAGQVLSTDGTSALSWVSAPVNGGTILAASGSTGTPGIAFNSDQDTGLWNPGANTLALSTGGSERLRVDSNGNVGIGTTTPTGKFSVGSAQAENAYFFYDNANVGNNDDGQSLYIYRRASEGNDYIRMYVENDQWANISSTGPMVINSSSLQLNGNTGGDVTVGGDFAIGSWTGGNPRLTIRGNLTEVGGFRYVQMQVNDTSNNFELVREDSNINYFDVKMPTIFTGGSVGIGTVSPGAKLDVAGNVKLGTTGTAFTASGVCTAASTAYTAGTPVNFTCTGVPASTSVAVNCSPSAALAGYVTARATGTVNQIAITIGVSATYTMTCMWMAP